MNSWQRSILQVAHPTYNDGDAKTKNEFVERLKDNGTHTGLVVIAPHRGRHSSPTPTNRPSASHRASWQRRSARGCARAGGMAGGRR